MKNSNNVRVDEELDDIDIRIISQVVLNAHDEYEASRGRGRGSFHGPVRLRSLRQRGVITEFMASVDQRRFGLQALIGVTRRPGARQANTTGFAEEMQGLPQVLQNFFPGGPDDFMVHIAVAD